jgi:metal-responsive CopG/Arc/MetJ family transcriptional regulator
MASNNPKILITLSSKIVERVDDYRYENRIPSRSEAIRRLLDEALKKYEAKQKK